LGDAVEVLADSSGLGVAFVRIDHAFRALKMIFTIRKNALFVILGQGKSGVKRENFCSWQEVLACAHYLGMAWVEGPRCGRGQGKPKFEI
jgi:hypothetical protein